ncbi:hypothetical protein VPH35_128292 [Triticum aestivum]
MEVRGFPEQWCAWVDAILRSSCSAVLLNGVPGAWFPVRCGLRQGDPMSPYLFLLVADVLQRMVRRDPLLQHPVVEGGAPIVLQYADDTLIIIRASVEAAARLRRILDDFAAATGLGINYGKSTLVPIHVADEVVAGAAGALSCYVQGFLQPYLGLPLSWDKLTAADFAPMLAKVDAYLAGWRARLLSPAGRLVLINAVLDSLPTYAMAAVVLPPAVVKAMDTLRRAFLWAAADRATGAQCLVAWSQVCRAKCEGGWGCGTLPPRTCACCSRCCIVYTRRSRGGRRGFGRS